MEFFFLRFLMKLLPVFAPLSLKGDVCISILISLYACDQSFNTTEYKISLLVCTDQSYFAYTGFHTFLHRHASHILSNAALLRVIVDLQCGSELCCDTIVWWVAFCMSGHQSQIELKSAHRNCYTGFNTTNPFYGSGHDLVFSGERWSGTAVWWLVAEIREKRTYQF